MLKLNFKSFVVNLLSLFFSTKNSQIKALRTKNGNQADLTPIYLDEFATLNHKGGNFFISFGSLIGEKMTHRLTSIGCTKRFKNVKRCAERQRESLSNCEL